MPPNELRSAEEVLEFVTAWQDHGYDDEYNRALHDVAFWIQHPEIGLAPRPTDGENADSSIIGDGALRDLSYVFETVGKLTHDASYITQRVYNNAAEDVEARRKLFTSLYIGATNELTALFIRGDITQGEWNLRSAEMFFDLDTSLKDNTASARGLEEALRDYVSKAVERGKQKAHVDSTPKENTDD